MNTIRKIANVHKNYQKRNNTIEPICSSKLNLDLKGLKYRQGMEIDERFNYSISKDEDSQIKNEDITSYKNDTNQDKSNINFEKPTNITNSNHQADSILCNKESPIKNSLVESVQQLPITNIKMMPKIKDKESNYTHEIRRMQCYSDMNKKHILTKSNSTSRVNTNACLYSDDKELNTKKSIIPFIPIMPFKIQKDILLASDSPSMKSNVHSMSERHLPIAKPKCLYEDIMLKSIYGKHSDKETYHPVFIRSHEKIRRQAFMLKNSLTKSCIPLTDRQRGFDKSIKSFSLDKKRSILAFPTRNQFQLKAKIVLFPSKIRIPDLNEYSLFNNK